MLNTSNSIIPAATTAMQAISAWKEASWRGTMQKTFVLMTPMPVQTAHTVPNRARKAQSRGRWCSEYRR